MSLGHDKLILETERLIIRPYVIDDLPTIHPILNAGFGESPLDERRFWLEWQIMSYTALSALYQPPYGDRALILKATGELIGSVGWVPSYGPFDKLPYFRARSTEPSSELARPEMGLFWVLGESHRGQGYATEAAQKMIDFMFNDFGLKRIVATTEYDNAASIAVMKRLGMTVERNPDDEPAYFQVIGILENPTLER
ncbi:MAG: N-acetyltransferase [Chloroflexi bacterium]|nr:MAG: N-acetyltransferase [Chloroflexota bacterium]